MFFKKRKAKENKDIARTVTQQQAYAKQFDDLFANIERTTDTADKVLKLEGLLRHIDSADSHISAERKYIVDNRTRKKNGQAGGAGFVAGAAAIAIPGAIVFPPILPLIGAAGLAGFLTGAISTEGRIKKKGQRLVAENADLNGFQALIAAKRAQAVEMLDETVKNCDLEKLPLCPNFEAALGGCVPLRERFAKASADAAKRAQEEKPVSKKLKIIRPRGL